MAKKTETLRNNTTEEEGAERGTVGGKVKRLCLQSPPSIRGSMERTGSSPLLKKRRVVLEVGGGGRTGQ